MDDKALRFRVGFLVAGTVLIAAILISLVGNRPALFQGSYKLNIDFPDAPSVTVNTPVRKSGILIGRVVSVDLLDEGGVRVTAKINDNIKLFDHEICEVKSSLLGDAEVHFKLLPGQKGSGKLLAAGATIHGRMAADPIQVVGDLQGSLSSAIGSVSQAAEKLGNAADEITGLLNRNKQGIDKIVNSVESTAQFTGDLFKDEKFRENLKTEVGELPQMLKDTRAAIETLHATMNNMNKTMGLVDQSLTDINALTKPLGQKGESMVQGMTDSIDKLNTVMEEVTLFVRKINSNEGSIGRLVNDDQLYQHLTRTAANIDELTTRLRPIVNDVRIITDKVARHPGVVLRDAVQPGPGTKGLPPGPTVWQR